LHEQIATEPFAGVLERFGGSVKVSVADQPYEAIAKVLALGQHENDDDNDEPRRRQGTDKRCEQVLQDLERPFA